ncbi:hypothetical protein [Candidatus Phytoplasma solani]|uniref:hypothetical protein n=1 Tax=Candidatus Phytoplasma solani TaxID=69896 RepID=UPI00358F5ABB
MIFPILLPLFFSCIDRDKDKLDADYKDYEKKKEEYKNNLESDKTIKEYGQSRELVKNIARREESIIDEYQKITDELTAKHEEVSDTGKLCLKKSELEQELEELNVEIENAKEELKNKSPNYNRAQQRLKEKQKQKQHAKFFQPITNK